MAESKTATSLDYKAAANAALKHLRRDRDRQIIAKRFGFGLRGIRANRHGPRGYVRAVAPRE